MDSTPRQITINGCRVTIAEHRFQHLQTPAAQQLRKRQELRQRHSIPPPPRQQQQAQGMSAAFSAHSSLRSRSSLDNADKGGSENVSEAAAAERRREASAASSRDNARSNTPGRDDSQGRASMKVYLFVCNNFLK